MNLSNELITQFVKATKDTTKTSSGETVNGTTVEYNGKMYVKLDGSDLLTPVTTTADVVDNERVTVLIKDHSATITGNTSSPAARTDDVKDVKTQITEFEILIGGKVSAEELEAQKGRIDELVSDNIVIREKLTATEAEIDSLVAEDVAINGKLTAQDAEITRLDAEKLTANAADIKFATIENLEVLYGEFHSLEATYGEFQELTTVKMEAVDANVKNLEAEIADIDALYAKKADVDRLEADIAEIDDLYAKKADVELLEADVAELDTLIFGSASGTSIQTSFANAVIAQLGDAQIKSAMIDNLSADKINSGSVNTNTVQVASEDGRLVISDETIQISDETRVRVQIGKDASNDYSINIWDAEGNLMFSEGGITDNAIKEAIIRNDMVAADANISANKLDISSLFTEINNSTETINAGRVLVDTDGQTLDVVFTTMTSDLNDLDETVTSQGTQLSVVQGQITSKVWQEDINTATNGFDEEIENLSTKYSTLEQTVDGLSSTVSEHATTIDTLTENVSVIETEIAQNSEQISLMATKTEVTEALDNYYTKEESDASIQIKANEIIQNVSETYATKTAVDDLSTRVGSAETSIAQNAEQIALRATKTELSDVSTSIDDVKSDLVANYYTKSQTDAQITVASNEITSTVSATYATKQEVDDIEIGGRNLIAGTSLDVVYSGNNGGTGTKDVWSAYTINPPTGTEYIISFDAKADADQDIACFFYSPNTTLTSESSTGQKKDPITDGHAYVSITTEWKRYWVKWTQTPAETVKNVIVGRCYTANTVYIRAVKMESGNKATDWSPAPEDMISSSDLENYATKTELIQTADSLTATVNAIKIGGRNLLLNTGGSGEIKALGGELVTSNINSWSNENGLLTLNCSASTTEIYYRFMRPLANNFQAVEPGETYTLSGKAIVTTTSGIFDKLIVRNQAYLGTAWSGGYSKDIVDVESTEWVDFDATFTVEEDALGYYISLQSYYTDSWEGVIKLKDLKLEKGNKVTDWSPAPEDMAYASDVQSISDEVASVTESISALDIKADNISASVTEIRTNTETAIESVNSTIETLSTEVSAKMTAEAVEIQIQAAMENGASKVVTKTGFTFDDDGLTVEKTDSEMKTQITEDGMTVYQNEEAVLVANNKGVDAKNLHATTYLIIGGRSRFENYGTDRTGCFWIGG